MDAVGEVQVISNGYTAENGRNNGGVISMVTKSGTNQLRASAWYNGRRDKFNENDYFREATEPAEAALPRQHLRLQRRRTGGDPGPDRQPEGRRQEVLLLRLAGIHRRRAADVDDAREHADGARVQRRLLADPGRRRPGTFQPIIDPITGQPFPGNRIPAAGTPACGVQFSCIDPLGQRMLRHPARGERHPEPAGGSGSGRRTRPTT